MPGPDAKSDQRILPGAVEVGKAAAPANEFSRASVLHDPAVVHHQHPVSGLHRGQAVGDDEGRPAGRFRARQEPRKALLHQPLGGDVQGGRRLVQDQYGRSGQERPGKTDELPLPDETRPPRLLTSVA